MSENAVDAQIGRLAVESQLITRTQLEQCLREQEEARLRGQATRLSQILLQRRLLTSTRLSELIAECGTREQDGVLLERYPLGERLGEGAQAVVYRAWDRSLNRPVAIKVLRAKGAERESLRLRFLREARVTAGLAHNNVIAVYDVGEAQGLLYLVMELVEGMPLSRLMEKRTLGLREAIEILEKAARGVGMAHEKGIVHRDLKPANILVTAAGEPKVGDFGLAHLMESTSVLTNTGTRLGTPLYMAPEQVRAARGDISPRTDVYALGVILYEILVGRPPFTGESAVELYTRILKEDPHPPARANPKTDRALEAICLRALEKDPALRQASATEFAEDLRRFLAGEPVKARRPGVWRKSVRWFRRRLALNAGIALATVIVGLALFLVRTVRETRLEQDRRIGELMEKAARAEREGRYVGAAESYEQILLLQPDHSVAQERLRVVRTFTRDGERKPPADPSQGSLRGGWRRVRKPITVAWPPNQAAALEIAGGPVTVRVVRRQARPAPVESAGDRDVFGFLAHPGANKPVVEYVSRKMAEAEEIRCAVGKEGLSTFYVRGPERLDEMVWVPDAAAFARTAVVSIDVELGAEVDSVTLAPDGYLELRGREGAAWLRMARPVVIDASGRRREGEIRANDREAIPPKVVTVELGGRRTLQVSLLLPRSNSGPYPFLIDWTWSSTASMATGRSCLGLARLEDGRVLIACGRTANDASSTCEVFDPATLTWSSTAGLPSSEARRLPLLTRLQDGRVLLTGGYVPDTQGDSKRSVSTLPTFATAFVWDPAGRGSWMPTVSRMSSGRAYHSAVLLTDGRVLVMGGASHTAPERVPAGGSSFTAGCDLYDPSTHSFWPAASMIDGRKWFGAIRLDDGRVLVAGGLQDHLTALDKCEIYFPDSGAGRWEYAASLNTARGMAPVLRLPDGILAVAGNHRGGIMNCEILSGGKWSPAGATPERRDGCFFSTDVIDTHGGVVIQAAGNAGGPTDKVHRYSRAEGTWMGPSNGEPLMNAKRDNVAGVRIEEGKMLVVGGRLDDTYEAFLDSAEIYEDSLSPNARPALPQTLSQVAGDVVLPDGATTPEMRIEFRALVSDPDGEAVCLQVDLEPTSREFDGAGLLTSEPVSSGSVASVASAPLAVGVSYHWRARVIDPKEAAGPWVEYEEGSFERADVVIRR
ncbi:MAG: protein kinase [Planctomycetes bacterium]|nr:protein kinase [Planctomycetota bacterium]